MDGGDIGGNAAHSPVRADAMPGDGDRTADPSVGPHPQTWPIKVEEFLAGPYMEPGDILLMRQRRSTFAWAVRRLTGSYFSKASMVFLVPHREVDFSATFVIEASFKGIELTDLASFLAAKEDSYVMALKRYDRVWFEQEERHLVRGLMLSKIKAGYDFGRLLDNLWGAVGNSAFWFIRIFLGPQRAVRLVLGRSDPSRLNKFVGPGFIQWGYHELAKTLTGNGLLGADAVDDIIFSPKVLAKRASQPETPVALDDILGVTAEDMADSDKLTWKYAIVDGLVHEIDSHDGFKALVNASRAKWRNKLFKPGDHSDPAHGGAASGAPVSAKG